MIEIQIFSMMSAILESSQGTVWSGALPEWTLNMTVTNSDSEVLENLYRFFNRVDIEDGETLESIGYQLPSLSVGDYVSFKRDADTAFTTYRVASLGFEKITGNQNALMEAYK